MKAKQIVNGAVVFLREQYSRIVLKVLCIILINIDIEYNKNRIVEGLHLC